MRKSLANLVHLDVPSDHAGLVADFECYRHKVKAIAKSSWATWCQLFFVFDMGDVVLSLFWASSFVKQVRAGLSVVVVGGAWHDWCSDATTLDACAS